MYEVCLLNFLCLDHWNMYAACERHVPLRNCRWNICNFSPFLTILVKQACLESKTNSACVKAPRSEPPIFNPDNFYGILLMVLTNYDPNDLFSGTSSHKRSDTTRVTYTVEVKSRRLVQRFLVAFVVNHMVAEWLGMCLWLRFNNVEQTIFIGIPDFILQEDVSV